MSIEETIIKNLIEREEFLSLFSPILKTEYFTVESNKILCNIILDFYMKYSKPANKEVILVELGNMRFPDMEVYNEAKELITSLDKFEDVNKDWLKDEALNWIRNQAVYNSVMKAAQILADTDKKEISAIPDMLSKAISISLDNNVGHDYFEDSDKRFEFYHDDIERIPFLLSILNTITTGGLPRKTLNILLAGTGVGKTLMMCDFAAEYMKQGYNVLYITMEMAEERIAERIDANMMNITLDSLRALNKDRFTDYIEALKEQARGKIIIKEYPTSCAHVGHFKSLLDELKRKKDFIPDIIFVDYLNICASQRLKSSNNVNSYSYVKSIAEEVRGLAVENDVTVWTATQTTRAGYGSSDLSLEDVSESFGVSATADFMIGLSQDEQEKSEGIVRIKQLKNRYGNLDKFNKFQLGIDKSRMKLFELDTGMQKDGGSVAKVVDNRSNNRYEGMKFS